MIASGVIVSIRSVTMGTAESQTQQYCEKFWRDSEDLISKLNTSASEYRKSRTLRIYDQSEVPCVYGVVINMQIVPDDRYNFWKLLKVGRTATNTSPGINRMETVKQEVNTWWRDYCRCLGEGGEGVTSILFVLPIRGGTDADVEKSVRKAMGIQVSKGYRYPRDTGIQGSSKK